MWKKVTDYVVPVILALSLLFVIVEFWDAVKWMFLHLKFYLWFFIGVASLFLLRLIPPVKKNESMLQTLSHELTHMIVGLLFFHKIHSIEAKEDNGVVWHSGNTFGGTFISLAPYFLPIFTFAFLLLRIIGAWKSLNVFDFFIGFNLAFHCICFAKQTRSYQTDIKSKGYLKSYLLIACALLFNLTIILLSIRKGIIKSNIYLFTNYWNDIVSAFKFIF